MKTRTYIIAGAIAFLIGLLITYAGFSFVLLEANPLKWDRESRVVFSLFAWFPPATLTLATNVILHYIEIERKSKP